MDARKVFRFIAITFLMSWTLALVFYLSDLNWVGPWGTVFGIMYMFMPFLGAVLVQKTRGENVFKPMGIKWKINSWWFLAWLLPVILATMALGVALLFPGVEYSPEMAGLFERFSHLLSPEEIEQMESQLAEMPLNPFLLTLLQGLFFGVTVNAVAGFGEEAGWRGLLQKEMEVLGFWKSALIIGFIWGVWHAPIILQGHNYPTYPLLGVVMMVIWCILLSPLFSYIRIKTGSVIGPSILHGSLNANVGLSLMYIKGGNELTVGMAGLAGFIVLVLVNLIIFLRDPNPGRLEVEQKKNS